MGTPQEQVNTDANVMQAARNELNQANKVIEASDTPVKLRDTLHAALAKVDGVLRVGQAHAEAWLQANPTPSPPMNPLDQVARGLGFTGSRIFSDTFAGGIGQWQNAAGVGSGASNGWPWRPEMLGSMSTSNVLVEPDGLHLRATYENGTATGSVVDTYGHFALATGLVLVRAKMPPGMDVGIWPAIWFLPGVPVPKDVDEIDVDEGGMTPFGTTGANGSIMWHYHIGPAGGAFLGGVPVSENVDLTADFHIYGMELLEGEIQLSLDGVRYAIISQSVANPVELILQNVVADPASTTWHSQPNANTPASADLVIAEVAAWGNAA